MSKSATATITTLQVKSNEDMQLATPSLAELLEGYRQLSERCDQVLEKLAKKSQKK